MSGDTAKGAPKKKAQVRVNIRDVIKSRPEGAAERLRRLEDMKRTLELKVRAHTVRRRMLEVQNERHELEVQKIKDCPEAA